jgi:hypothetical protein
VAASLAVACCISRSYAVAVEVEVVMVVADDVDRAGGPAAS